MKKMSCYCDRCGKAFDEWDRQESFAIKYFVGYGSKYDGETIDMDLCCSCFDHIVDEIYARQKEWKVS